AIALGADRRRRLGGGRLCRAGGGDPRVDAAAPVHASSRQGADDMTRKLGDATLTMVNGGDFRLDGGAMHGVVPKTLWSRLVSCDAQNRVEYATNCLLVEGRGRRILIETGNGDKFPARERGLYGIDHDRRIATTLRDPS